jgi:HEAT repeat protein
MTARGMQSTALGRRLRRAAALVGACVAVAQLAAQERGPSTASPTEVAAAIDKLGDLDYETRSKAARTIRRTAAAQVVPALADAASTHGDSYVPFKALVLLSGFNDPRAESAMREALASKNDRLREVAYAYFEHHPAPALTGRLLAALESEHSEFVRPALIRALAALAPKDPKVAAALVVDAGRGVDYFRGTVIEALGDYKVASAAPKLAEVAKLDGPLQDDAAIALGKIGGPLAVPTLAEMQRTAPRERQPAVAAAICLAGQNCSSHLGYLQRVTQYADKDPGYQDVLRGAAASLGALAATGNADALKILLEAGIPSQDPVRAPLALALGLVAIRDTPLLLKALETHPDRPGAVLLLADGFDMLEEDFEEERFFAAVRRAYWAAPDGSATRQLCEQLITRLDF